MTAHTLCNLKIENLGNPFVLVLNKYQKLKVYLKKPQVLGRRSKLIWASSLYAMREKPVSQLETVVMRPEQNSSQRGWEMVTGVQLALQQPISLFKGKWDKIPSGLFRKSEHLNGNITTYYSYFSMISGLFSRHRILLKYLKFN